MTNNKESIAKMNLIILMTRMLYLVLVGSMTCPRFFDSPTIIILKFIKYL